MCTVKKEIDIGCDYELANRHSSDKLLNQIYRRQDSRDSMLTGSGSERIVTIHDELAQLRSQISHLQRTVDQLPERICALLRQPPTTQNSSSFSVHNGNTFKPAQTLARMDADCNDNEDDDFDKLSSEAPSILSDIEILHESIEDNNRDLLAWCRRLQLNDITNHISVEPIKEEPAEPAKPEVRFQSNLFEEWEKRYSSASVKPEISIVKCTDSGVPTLIPNYSSEVDKNIWLK